ncbi:AAA domain-containing protein [Formicincola oecophyllae]|uniref:AAA domain-containing protein n=1 Tax=Formicincola oecophyllae TaxID=2558361 RepID=A0A4Y6U938_9PROT|nr:AAA family ATPase [Formicincola oecophyllae]QDH13078.1 AAA domain-containing protein [Formicincola oecophyllae]
MTTPVLDLNVLVRAMWELGGNGQLFDIMRKVCERFPGRQNPNGLLSESLKRKVGSFVRWRIYTLSLDSNQGVADVFTRLRRGRWGFSPALLETYPILGEKPHEALVERLPSVEALNQFTAKMKALHALDRRFEKEREWIEVEEQDTILEEKAPPSPLVQDNFTHSLDHAQPLFMDDALFQGLLEQLSGRKNLLLKGEPGVGKTFLARRLAQAMAEVRFGTEINSASSGVASRVHSVQFHQNYDYADFMEGFSPGQDGKLQLQQGLLRRVCDQAMADSSHAHVLIVDEFNRGNVAAILGEGLSLLEASKRGPDHALKLARSGDAFWLPPNLYIIATMNTADRTLAPLDYALKRRFALWDVKPAFSHPAFLAFLTTAMKVPTTLAEAIVTTMEALNVRLLQDMGKQGFQGSPAHQVGHSFFMPSSPPEQPAQWCRGVVEGDIVPLLHDYALEGFSDALPAWLALLAPLRTVDGPSLP